MTYRQRPQTWPLFFQAESVFRYISGLREAFKNKPKMAYSRDALLENSKRQERDKTRVGLERERLERDKRETREIWSYGVYHSLTR